MKKKVITSLSIIGLFIVLLLNGSIAMDKSTKNVGIMNLFKINTALAAPTEITVDCTDNPHNSGDNIYRRCEAGCPKVSCFSAPINGKCKYTTEETEIGD